MRNLPSRCSNPTSSIPVGFDWHGIGYLNVSILTKESQGVVAAQRLNDVVTGLEFLIPDYKIECDGRFALGSVLRMAWHCREGKNPSESNS